MKIACDKCLVVEDADRIKDWLPIKAGYGMEYKLCPVCADGFWMAVDNMLPPIVNPKNND